MARTIEIRDEFGAVLIINGQPVQEVTVDPPGPPYRPNAYNETTQRMKLGVECHNTLDANGRLHPWSCWDATANVCLFGQTCSECGGALPV